MKGSVSLQVEHYSPALQLGPVSWSTVDSSLVPSTSPYLSGQAPRPTLTCDGLQGLFVPAEPETLNSILARRIHLF